MRVVDAFRQWKPVHVFFFFHLAKVRWIPLSKVGMEKFQVLRSGDLGKTPVTEGSYKFPDAHVWHQNRIDKLAPIVNRKFATLAGPRKNLFEARILFRFILQNVEELSGMKLLGLDLIFLLGRRKRRRRSCL